MTTTHPFLIMFVTVMLLSAISVTAQAEIPKKSKQKLNAEASHQLIGTVIRSYDQEEKRGNFEYTHSVAEVAVETVGKGTEIEKGDRVFVRFWKKRFVGTGNPPPDHYGHWNAPQQSDKVEIYVEGDRKSGFDVVSPNGFYAEK